MRESLFLEEEIVPRSETPFKKPFSIRQSSEKKVYDSLLDHRCCGFSTF